MKNTLFIIALFFSAYSLVLSQDTIRKYQSEDVKVEAYKFISPFESYYFGTDYNSDFLNRNGVTLIRRGSNFTQDIYSEGFNRGDIKITIDGEQYHNACPNRMDAPASRINPLEMESVEISKSSSSQGAGIYGRINYNRKALPSEMQMGIYGTADLIAQNNYDFGANFGLEKQAIFVRYSQGDPYTDANGKSFSDLYGYAENPTFTNLKVSYRGEIDDFKYGASFNKLENIAFAYLMMDETDTKVFNVDFSYKNNKLYFNYTDHIMDNSLRATHDYMISQGKNLTLGLVGDNYELTYRNWNLDNMMDMHGMVMESKTMPDINQFYIATNYQYLFSDFISSARVGLYYYDIGDETALDRFKPMYSDAEKSRILPVGAVNLAYIKPLDDDFSLSSSIEIAVESPEAEELYFNMKRMGTNPDWFGNPTLELAKKGTFRLGVSHKYFDIEFFGNRIWDFANIHSIDFGGKRVQTLTNINATILGVNTTLRYEFIESNISYIYGENLDDNTPIAEIMPLTIVNMITLPEVYGVKSQIIHHYENYQSRVDKSLNEFPSDAWNTFGLRLSYLVDKFSFRMDIDNILNHQYFRHLSYARNPYSSGLRVFEPGTSMRFTVMYQGIFN